MLKQIILAAIASGVLLLLPAHPVHAEPALRIGTFDIDATPPLGAPLAYNRVTKRTGRLSCRGVVLLPSDQPPIVMAAIDWIGVGNDAYDDFRKALADAVGTSRSRVAFHALHQHDAPRCDFAADAILAEHGLGGEMFDVAFARDVMRRAAAASRDAKAEAVAISHFAVGQAKIEKVASNRRILGPDGKVKFTRYTATRDPKIRAFPVGKIDPFVKLIAFWAGDRPVAVLSYYATHPQSYYRTGDVSPDFPGIARDARDAVMPGTLHVHFNGAGGDIGAGKWNDGDKANRTVLAKRVELGMASAWQQCLTDRKPIKPSDVGWSAVHIDLPASTYLNRERLVANVKSDKVHRSTRIRSAVHLAWLNRAKTGGTDAGAGFVAIELSCLRIGIARVLHMPGELLVEYQLKAQKMAPDRFVCMAAYGDYGPGYIGTEAAYAQGGYETSPLSSRVAPSVESPLIEGVRQLLAR